MKKKELKQKVNLFQNLQSIVSVTIVMDEVVRLIMHDRDVATKTESYRKMMAILGKAKANEEVKQKLLPAISVAVMFDGNGRKAAHILGFTGLALVDLDHIENIEEVLMKVKSDPHTLMVYKTVSGQGLRIIYRYQREQPDEHINATTWPAAFAKGNQHYALLTGCEYDDQCSDYSRLCGLAHDEEVFVNWEAEPFIITDEEIPAANFAGDHEKGKPRKQHPTGTFSVGVEDAWEKVESALQKRGMTYSRGHHHDYVMHASFLMNRYGVELDELLDWAAQEWSDYDAKQREATIRSCYKKSDEHGTWRLNRQGRKSKETSMITLPEIRQWLSQKVEVIYNVVTDISMWRLLNEKEWAQLDERVVCSMRSQIAQDTGKRVLKSDVTDVLRSDFSRLYHPVREYIEALPHWDGQDRVNELSSHVRPSPLPLPEWRGVVTWAGGKSGCSLFEWALHKWMVAMVATWMSDLSTNHEIFVLIGEQGIYKTTFFRHILPPPLRMYFWENAHNSFSSKDDHLALSENCLVEIEEIDLQNPRDISELKALATSEKVKERRPYARFREEKHRLASICGSGNQQRFLSDDTGNRRWLCHKVDHIDDPRTWGLDYDQLYAQLRDEWRSGFRYWFDPDEQRIVELQNEAFRIESDEEQLIRTRLRPPHADEKITLMNAASIAQYINGGVVGRGVSTRKISLAMPKLGFKRIHTKQGWFYEVFLIPLDLIQNTLAQVDETTEKESVMPTMTEGDLPF